MASLAMLSWNPMPHIHFTGYIGWKLRECLPTATFSDCVSKVICGIICSCALQKADVEALLI